MSKINIIPIFVPHLGCPNDCVFCNQRRITGLNKFSLEDVPAKIEEYLGYFSAHVPRQIAFYGGSFTAIAENLQIKLLSIAKSYKDQGLIDGIRLSTRPDAINSHILDYLKFYGVDTIELGIQSMKQEVLDKSKRGHDLASVYEAVDLIKSYGFTLGLQQMVGLPADSENYSIETTKDIIALQPDFVRIYPTLVIKNTELEDMYRQGSYRPIELDQAVTIVTKLLMLYQASNIEVVRIGLQATENLKFEKDVVAGPLHDAFRELCESEKLFSLIKDQKINTRDSEEVVIYSNSRNNSLLVGQKAINKEKLKKLFKVDKIKFKIDNDLGNSIKIITKETYIINIEEKIKKIVKGW